MIGAVAPSDPDLRKSYKLADGSVIPDKGSNQFSGFTEEGWGRTMTAHVTNVDRPLLSVLQIIQHGGRVVFDKSGSYIDGPGGQERIHLMQRGGLCTMKLWIPRDQNNYFQWQA